MRRRPVDRRVNSVRAVDELRLTAAVEMAARLRRPGLFDVAPRLGTGPGDE
jgi:hypothetical protein